MNKQFQPNHMLLRTFHLTISTFAEFSFFFFNLYDHRMLNFKEVRHFYRDKQTSSREAKHGSRRDD